MILQVDSPLMVPQVLRLAAKVDKLEVEVLENMLAQGLQRDDAMILIEKKDDDVRGFCYATMDYMEGELVVFIQACYIEPDAPQAGHEMLLRLRQWGGSKGLRYMYFLSRRDSAAWNRKYKFDVVSHLLRRRI
jgi:hypothetical protein